MGYIARKEITVDYDLLYRQMSALARAETTRGAIDNALLSGLYELLASIAEQRPFKEGKDNGR